MANNSDKTFRDLLSNGQAQILGIVSIVPMGNWNATTTYQKLNYVRHNGATYLAKTSSTNVEPGVAQNWQDVWMLCNYDGGIVVPDGTYPEMTVGAATHAESADSATHAESADSATNATNVTGSIGGQELGDIFESDGTTVKKATYAESADSATNAVNATKATQDGGGNNIQQTYATKEELTDGLAGKQDAGNYALQNGSYPNLTAGAATLANTAPNTQAEVPNGDNSNKIATTGFLQPAIMFSVYNSEVSNNNYRAKDYNINVFNLDVSNGFVCVQRSGNVVMVSGWCKNRYNWSAGTAYKIMSGLPNQIEQQFGCALWASVEGTGRVYGNLNTGDLYLVVNTTFGQANIPAGSYFNFSYIYITNG